MENDTLKVHQIWYQGLSQLPERYHIMRETWDNDDPHIEYRLWDRHQIDDLFKAYPTWDTTYQSLPTMIEKIDFAKYLILFHEGGLYADMDIYRCSDIRPLVDLLKENDLIGFAHNASRWTLVHHRLFGMQGRCLVNNAVILSKAKCPVLQEVLNESAKMTEKYKWLVSLSKHLRIILTTGPLMYSNVLHRLPNVKIISGKESFEPYNPAQIRTLYAKGLSPVEIVEMTRQKHSVYGVHFMDLTWLTKGPSDPRQRVWIFLSKIRTSPLK